MNCHRAAGLIYLYAGGELLRTKAWRLGRHLKGCSACREAVEEFRAALSAIRTAAQRDERDWPETEWQNLMTRIKTQPPPRRAMAIGMLSKTAWAYSAAALLILGLSVILLRTKIFPPVPVSQTEILASTEVQPGRSLEFADSQLTRLRQDIPFRARAERRRVFESETLIAGSARGQGLQDMVSMTLVSQETGLKVHWTFNRNFEWKEEEKR